MTVLTKFRQALVNEKRRDQIIGAGLILGVWEIYGRMTSSLVMAPISEIAVKFVELYLSGVIIDALAVSVQSMAVGYLLATSVALIVGMSMGRSNIIEYLLDAYTNVLFVTSYSALLPLLIIFFGISFQFRVVVVFLSAVFHMIFSFKSGVENIDEDLVDTGRVFGASRYHIYRHVVLPASLPFIIAGLRLGLGRSWKGMVVAELWVIVGVGSLLDAYQQQLALAELFVVIITLMLLGIVSVRLLYWVQHRFTPWESGTV